MGLYFNGMKIFNIVVWGSPHAKIVGDVELISQNPPPLNQEWQPFLEPDNNVDIYPEPPTIGSHKYH